MIITGSDQPEKAASVMLSTTCHIMLMNNRFAVMVAIFLWQLVILPAHNSCSCMTCTELRRCIALLVMKILCTQQACIAACCMHFLRLIDN